MTPDAISALIVLAAKYGPQLILDLEAIFKKADPTITDIADLFRKVKPYADYNIPDATQVAS